MAQTPCPEACSVQGTKRQYHPPSHLESCPVQPLDRQYQSPKQKKTSGHLLEGAVKKAIIKKAVPNMRNKVNIEVIHLRSSGLFDGFLSTKGAKISTRSPIPGRVTPAIIGWNMVRSSCRPRKYHGAFDGFGVLLKSAACISGAFTTHEKTNKNAVHARPATNSTANK